MTASHVRSTLWFHRHSESHRTKFHILILDEETKKKTTADFWKENGAFLFNGDISRPLV